MSGLINHYHRPAGLGVRVDDFIYSGYSVSPFYDSMLAKVIVSGQDRDECLARMTRPLERQLLKELKLIYPSTWTLFRTLISEATITPQTFSLPK